MKLGFHLIGSRTPRFGARTSMTAAASTSRTTNPDLAGLSKPRSLGSIIEVSGGIRVSGHLDRYRFASDSGGLPTKRCYSGWFRSAEHGGGRSGEHLDRRLGNGSRAVLDRSRTWSACDLTDDETRGDPLTWETEQSEPRLEARRRT